jgi:2'-5' RNA ligase
MDLLAETYVVLDVPEPVASRVRSLRVAAADDFRSALPVEITLIGSGGAGAILPSQEVSTLTATVRSIAETTQSIETSFGSTMRFPGSDVFVLTLSPATAIVELHRRLRASGLTFRPSPWAYVPHCTIRSRAPVLEEESAALLGERIDESFTLSSLSIYTTDRLPRLQLVDRVSLSAVKT